MPVIARFYGMVAKMYLLGSEHNPPYVHFLYGEYNGVIDLTKSKSSRETSQGKPQAWQSSGLKNIKANFWTCGIRSNSRSSPPARMSGE